PVKDGASSLYNALSDLFLDGGPIQLTAMFCLQRLQVAFTLPEATPLCLYPQLGHVYFAPPLAIAKNGKLKMINIPPAIIPIIVKLKRNPNKTSRMPIVKHTIRPAPNFCFLTVTVLYSTLIHPSFI
ncbi:hypothetical protein, partial [Bacillus velezensis]|uniref:hypothetical protein n=1 Tax=Bacillus velezensis TaxID=492670 RepID=UPI002DB780B5